MNTADEHISCSGTTFGSTAQVLLYLSRMNDWTAKVIEQHKLMYQDLETDDQHIYDQAIHNYILYRLDWNGRLEFLENDHSPVLTLSSFGEFKFRETVRTAL